MLWSIQRKLTALVLVVLLPLLAGVLVEFWGEMRSARERADEELLAAAQAVARRLEDALTGVIQTMDALLALRGVDGPGDADLAAFVSSMRVAHPFVRGLVAVAADGRLLATSGPRLAATAPSPVDLADLRAALRGRQPVVAPPGPGIFDPGRAVTLFVPARDRRGEPAGAAIAEIDLAALSLFLEGVPPGRGGGIAVTTVAGHVIAGAGSGAWSVRQTLSPGPEALAIVKQRGGAAAWRAEDGQTRLAAAAPMRRPDWVVVATVPWEPVARTVRARLVGDLRWVVLAALVALLIATVISRRMHRSVQALIAGTTSLAGGDGTPIVVETRDELAELAQRFNRSVEDRRSARVAAETRQRQLEALADVNLALSRQLDVDVVVRQVVEQVRGLLRVHSSALFRLEPESRDLVALAVTGATGATFTPGLVSPQGMGAVGLAVETASPVASRNVLTDERIRLTAEMGAAIEGSAHRSVLAVPLVVGGTVIGGLSVGDVAGREFDAEETRLLRAFADQAALALDNARLLDQTRQRLRHLDSLCEVVAQILEPLSLEDRLNLITRKAAELVGGDRATVALMAPGGETLEVRAGYNLFEGELGSRVPLGQGGLGVAVATRGGVLVEDYQRWPTRNPLVVARQGQRPILGAIAHPLLIRGEVIGAIAVGTYTPGTRLSRDDLDRLASFAGPAALAIEHSRLYGELEARLRQIEETQAQLVQAAKLSAVGQLVSGVAHELNNPLSVVMGHGQILLSKEPPPEMRRPVEQILAQATRMAKIVQGLLLFARQRKRTHEAVSIPRVIEQTLALRADQLRLSRIQVEVEHPDDLPPAAGDAHQLQQVFLNLLLNAEQAIAGAGGRISVRSGIRPGADPPRLRVEVSDDGPGIPAGILPRIFDPFFTTKDVGKGTGLGLSVSHGIVEQHGGRLSVESRPGHTVFTVELPVMAEPAPPVSEPPSASPRVTGPTRRVLVVDDEPFIVDFLTTVLGQAGWQVEVCGGGHAALERVRSGAYDLIVSDLRMAEGSGEDFYRAMTAERPALARRFLCITGDTANPEAWRFLRGVGVPVLEKPFSADAFLRAVHEVTA